MHINAVLQTHLAAIPDCVAIGYVEMSTGALLGVKTRDAHPSEMLELVAAATGDLFQGRNVSALEALYRRSNGLVDESEQEFQDIIVNSGELIHVFLRARQAAGYAAVFVCKKTANLGMALSKARLAMPHIESAL